MPIELDQSSLQDVNKALALLAEADELIRKCKQCGFDTQAQELMSAALRARLDAIRHNFGPQRRD